MVELQHGGAGDRALRGGGECRQGCNAVHDFLRELRTATGIGPSLMQTGAKLVAEKSDTAEDAVGGVTDIYPRESRTRASPTMRRRPPGGPKHRDGLSPAKAPRRGAALAGVAHKIIKKSLPA